MNKADFIEMAAAHAQMMRRSIKEPSAASLALWSLEDARSAALIRYYDDLEANEPVSVHIIQEVKH